jgi:hypothetical protein
VRKHLLYAAAGGLALALGGAGTAHAVPSYADAQLNFTNFKLTGVVDANGNPLSNISGFTSSVSTTTNANYPTAPTVDGHTDGGNLSTGSDAGQSLAGPISFTPPAQNTFSQVLTPPGALTPAGTRSDVRITGALASGATSNLIAEGKLSLNNSSASSNAGSSTTLQFTFTTSTATTVTLSFDATSFLFGQVGTLGDSANPQTSATYSVKNLSDGTTVRLEAPTALNQNLATTNPANIVSFTGANPAGGYSFTDVLQAGKTYQITLADNVTEILTTTTATPEPASLALIGSGLVAAGFLGRRKKKG